MSVQYCVQFLQVGFWEELVGGCDSDSGLLRRLRSRCWRSPSWWEGALGLKEMFPHPLMLAGRSELLRTWWREASFPCHVCIFVKLLTTWWFSSPRARQGCLWEGGREGEMEGLGETETKSQWPFLGGIIIISPIINIQHLSSAFFTVGEPILIHFY